MEIARKPERVLVARQEKTEQQPGFVPSSVREEKCQWEVGGPLFNMKECVRERSS